MAFEYFWQFVTNFGDMIYWIGFFVSFALIYTFLDKRDKKRISWILYVLLPSVLIAYGFSEVLKFLFQIPRPCFLLENCPTGYSFPSSHATIITAFAIITILNLKKPKLYILPIILAVLVGLSRIALGYHTLTDVIGGAVIGFFVSILVNEIYKKLSKVKIRIIGYYLRKLVHISGIIFIPLSFILSRNQFILIFIFGTPLFLLLEYLRVKKNYIPIYKETVTLLSNPPELKSFLFEPLFYVIAIFLLFSFFPLKSFYIGTISLIIGDGLAGLIGFRFGKTKLPYNKRKSVEGSLACFISTFAFSLFFLNFFSALTIAIITTLLESFLGKGENLILPLTIGFILMPL